MAADGVGGHALGYLAVALEEGQLARVEPCHRLADMGAGEGAAQRVVAHAGAGGIGHLGGLQVDLRVREEVKAARVVEMEMRQDKMRDVLGRHPEGRERGADVLDQVEAAFRGLGPVEAGVDDDHFRSPAEHPEVEVDGVGRGVVVVVQEGAGAGAGRVLGVADREDLPVRHALYSACASLRFLPETPIASVAAMNPSRSPSRTPEVSEVSWFVLRSFTIW